MHQTDKAIQKTVLLIILTLIATVSYAQLTMNGELRPRFEYRHGLKTLFDDGKEPAAFISQRTRINLVFKEKKYTIGISFQDVRVWGGNPLTNTFDNNSSFHEAWAELKLTNKLNIKLGRQELQYDDNRLFSIGDWNQQGRSHDMALLKWNPSASVHVNFGFAFNQEKEQMDTRIYSISNNYQTMQIAWMHKDWNKNGLSLLFTNIGNEQLQTLVTGLTTYNIRFSQTFGVRYSYNDKLFSLNSAVYLQKGKDVTNRNINANYANLDLTVVLNNQWSIIPRTEHFSGTSTKDISPLNTNYSFNPLFGGAHRVNGTMDYFYCSNYLDNVGLNDYSLSLNYLKDKFSTLFTVHFFDADAQVVNLSDKSEPLNKNLGTELDLQLVYKVNANITCTFGYSQLFATRTMEVLKGGDKNSTNNYTFMMISFKPQFIK